MHDVVFRWARPNENLGYDCVDGTGVPLLSIPETCNCVSVFPRSALEDFACVKLIPTVFAKAVTVQAPYATEV
jgi:hypothetical protein